MKKVVFYCDAEESDVYEFDDDISHSELMDEAGAWVSDNVGGYYEIIEDEDEEDWE